MSDEQRALFRETQAVMSLLEGFGDHVMDAVGKDLVPGRRADLAPGSTAGASSGRRSSAPCCGSRAWTSRWSSTVRARRSWPGSSGSAGAAALRRLWDGPETLPTPEEIDEPDGWVRRMGLEPARRRRRVTDGGPARAPGTRDRAPAACPRRSP